MLLSIVLLVAVAAAVARDFRDIDYRIGKQNFGSLSSSSSTSTSSSDDSSSTDSRIANAVEAALRAAQAQPAVVAPNNRPYGKYRLRLNTSNRQSTCGTFDCAEIQQVCPGGVGNVALIQGAIARVKSARGDFEAVFDNTGLAEQLNDRVRFSVQFDGCRKFTLTTELANARGLNVTSLTIATQNSGDAVTGNIYFRPIGPAGSFKVEEGTNIGNNLVRFPTLNAANGASAVGCDATFDNIGRLGYTSFTVTAVGGNAPHLVTNTSIPAVGGGAAVPDNVMEFEIDNSWIINMNGRNSAGELWQDQLRDIGLDRLPCARRGSIIYDEIVIATMRTSPAIDEVLDHPLLYDALQIGTAGANPSFESFIFQLQVAAGRTQVRLRDITLDPGAFSILSHNSKFTNCFRVWPDPDYVVETFIGIRGSGGAMVRGILKNTGAAGDLVKATGTVNGVTVWATRSVEDGNGQPAVQVEEIGFGDLRQRQSTPARPFEILRSDVDIIVEDCPEFSYFQ